MSPTNERELTSPVELCGPGGHSLNPVARGWSRTPLHTANLRGGWGRNKRWDYWCVLCPGFAIAITYADVDYLGLATVWWVDLETGTTGGHEATLSFARGVGLPDRPGSEPLRYRGRKSSVEISDDSDGTSISASWTEADGQRALLDLRIDLPAGHESLNVVIPWSARRFQYTSKHQARPAFGTLTIGRQVRSIGPTDEEPSAVAWGVLDVGRGRWPYRTRWNWGGGAGRTAAGRVIGLQFGGKWTEGTGFTENGVIVDGRLTKIGQELEWIYDWEHPMGRWRVRHRDGSLDVTLAPTFDRHTKLNALILATEVHQVFGTWSGHITDEHGERHQFTSLLGFAEESRSRW